MPAAGSFFIAPREDFMRHDFENQRSIYESSEASADEVWRFVQTILGNEIYSDSQAESEAIAERKQLEWLAKISTRHEHELRALQEAEAQAAKPHEGRDTSASAYALDEAWNRSQPRLGGPPNAGWWASTGGSKAGKSPAFLDSVIKRNQTVADLTGVASPGLVRSSRLAATLQAAGKLPAEVERGAAAGLRTGGKAVVNGTATAIKNVATLGLKPGELELIGVTKEDREAGYDTAVTIATASGEVLVAVGTGGLASALSKGGTIARTASAAMVVFDAAGNGVGVVQGIYDAH
jgi:hypothetical protein